MAIVSRRERGAEGNNLSFLDVISAGFGAIVLLLVITRTAEPILILEQGQKLEEQREALLESLPEVDARVDRLRAMLGDRDSELQATLERIQSVQPRAAEAQRQIREARVEEQVAETISDRLFAARQQLTEEMRRLQQQASQPQTPSVAGIPVDSEYVIFIIDTSGSMLRSWGQVMRKFEETLDMYPELRGMQVMNDMGQLMFEQYQGQWMPDTPSRRRVTISRLARWHPFSNSSPVEGIRSAIRNFQDPDKKISLFVFGDEFTGISIQAVLDEVERLNPRNADGRRQVRIHAVGFPTQLRDSGAISPSGMQFALLMRELTRQHDGSFVALQR
ncbi:MAG: hypothetical protein ACNA7E_00950 [Wenzhouxiangellaceae bacterium]